MNNNSENMNSNMLETSCNNVYSTNNSEQNCECGFDEEMEVFPSDPMLAQSYVPWQYMENTFKPCVGLENGTIFPELVSPYMPGDSMRNIEYISNTNSIGEGCNS
jgi:hypothetical protein